MNLLEILKKQPYSSTPHHPYGDSRFEHTWCVLCGLDYVRGEQRHAGDACPVCRGEAVHAFESQEVLKKLLAEADTLSDADLELMVDHIAGGWPRAKFRDILDQRTKSTGLTEESK